MTIQLDYGGFDPTFLGVTIRFTNERAWSIYDDFVRNPKPPKIDLTKPNEAFESLSITSVTSHEVRHFHDFLLTAYSAHVFRLRIQALLNLLQLLPVLAGNEGGNCIPVPISTWSRLTKDERQEQLSWLPNRADKKAWMPISIPFVDPSALGTRPDPSTTLDSIEGVKGLIIAAMHSISKLGELTHNPNTTNGNTSFQAWQVFELSGLLTQTQEIWLTYGQKETEFFLQYLLSAKRNPYGAMLRVVWHLWDQKKRLFDFRLTSVMTLWSLLGSYKLDGWDACPTTRFLRLWEYLSTKGSIDDYSHPFDLFNHWSQALGVSTVDEGLDDAIATFGYVRDLVQNRVLGIADSFLNTNYGPFLLRVTNGVLGACKHMVSKFRAEPAKYVFPDLYLEQVPNFVNPTQRIAADGGLLRFKLPGDALREKGYIIEWARMRDGEELVASAIVPLPLSNFSFTDAHDVHELSTMIALTDFLFADTARATADIQRAGETWFSQTNVQPLEILN